MLRGQRLKAKSMLSREQDEPSGFLEKQP
jgi:hypothetical protein